MNNYSNKPDRPLSGRKRIYSLISENSWYKKISSFFRKENLQANIKLLNSEIKRLISLLTRENMLKFLKNLNQPQVAAISLLLIIIIALIDHITVYDFGFFVLYYIPLIFFSWYSNKIGAVLISIFTINVLYIANYHTSYQYTLTFGNIWNMTLLLASFMLVSVGAQHVAHLLKAEKELSGKLKIAINEIKLLSGLLPICAICKKIRNDKGYWEQIEAYIGKHSEAEFTHAICPDCMKEKFPQISEKEMDEQDKGR